MAWNSRESPAIPKLLGIILRYGGRSRKLKERETDLIGAYTLSTCGLGDAIRWRSDTHSIYMNLIERLIDALRLLFAESLHSRQKRYCRSRSGDDWIGIEGPSTDCGYWIIAASSALRPSRADDGLFTRRFPQGSGMQTRHRNLAQVDQHRAENISARSTYPCSLSQHSTLFRASSRVARAPRHSVPPGQLICVKPES